MWHVWFRVLAAVSLLLTQVGCSTGLGGEALTCLTSNDCPPQCECPNPGRFCVTDSNESTPCGGSCDAETSCPDGTSCSKERTEGSVELHSCLPDGAGGTGGAGGVGGTGGTGGTGGSGGSAGSGGSVADVFADAVDDALTSINDLGCLGNCIGEPANATGPPEGKGGNTTSVSLGPGGTLGLVFVDELCVVDGDPNTPDIVVYEVGGVQREDFSLKVALAGEENLEDGQINSRTSFNEPERHLDVTAVINGSGMVERSQISDLDDNRDEPEEEGFEDGWGADIDAVACFSR